MDTNIYTALRNACLAAAKIQLENYGKDLTIHTKDAPTDFVTEVDIRSQKAIIESITESMIKDGYDKDDIGFIGEEGIAKKAKHLFIIDPLDGTKSYIEKNGYFCISIAYLIYGKLCAGMIYRPTEEIFYFADEGGAFKIEQGTKTELKVIRGVLAEARLAYNLGPFSDVSEKVMQAVSKIEPKIKEVKKTRSGILTLLLSTQDYDFALNGGAKLWDIAAAKMIIEKAGGRLSDWDGIDIKLDLDDTNKSYEVIAGEENLVKEILKYLK